MHKYINISFVYGILALISGVFYREFTKYLGFSGKTVLAVTHVHLFALGLMLFLLVGIFSIITNLTEQKHFKKFMIFYNIGLIFMVVMFYVRGIYQVSEIQLSRGLDAAISGMAGLSHITITVGIVFLFLSLRKSEKTV